MTTCQQWSRGAVFVTLNAVLVAGTSTSFAQEPAYGRYVERRVQFRTVSLPDKTSLDVPAKDWLTAMTFGTQLVLLIEKKAEAVVALDRVVLGRELDPTLINELYAAGEAEIIQKREPRGRNYRHWLKEIDGRRFVVVRYERDGLHGAEEVVIYTFPVGAVAHRIQCSAPTATFQKYAPLFGHIAWSFKTAAAAQ